MAQVSFQNVMAFTRVLAFCLLTYKLLRLAWRNTQVENEVLAGKAVDGILQMLNPTEKLRAFFRVGASDLVSQIGSHVAVHQDDVTRVQSRFDSRFGFKAVSRVEQRGKVRVNCWQ